MDLVDFKVNPFPQEYAHTCTHVSTHVSTTHTRVHTPHLLRVHVHLRTRPTHVHVRTYATPTHTCTRAHVTHTCSHHTRTYTCARRTHGTAVHVHTHTTPHAHGSSAPSSPSQPPLCTSSSSFLGPPLPCPQSPIRLRGHVLPRSHVCIRRGRAPPPLPGFSRHTESDCETHPGTAHPLVCSFLLLRGTRCVDTPRAASPFSCWGHLGCFQSSAVLHTPLRTFVCKPLHES